MPADPQHEVRIGGRRFSAWTRLSVSRSLEAVAGTVSFEGMEPDEWTLDGRQLVEVRESGELVFSGYLDSIEVRRDANEHSVTASGRARTADLVDSSIVPTVNGTEWFGVTLEALVRELSDEALRIPFVYQVGEAITLERFAANPGETFHDAIERACRRTGVLATTDAQGRLVLTRPARERAAVSLVDGRNVVSLTASVDFTQRFRFVGVAGQGTPSEDFGVDLAVGPYAEIEDEAVRTTRQTYILADGPVDEEGCKARAQWEATIRAARASRVTCEVEGWRQEEGGALWAPNLLVPVELPPARYRGDLLVEGVAYEVDRHHGARATLGLVRPDAYRLLEQLPEVEDPGAALLAGLGWES